MKASTSKLGPHCIGPTTDARRMMDAGARIIKFVDDFGYAGDLVKAGYTGLMIGRVFSSFDAASLRGLPPTAAALKFHNSQAPKYSANQTIKTWEGHNEFVPGNRGDMEWYCQHELARMKFMEDMGLTAVIGCFATGNPGDFSLWQYFLPALSYARAHGHILGLHEYSSPWMWWMTNHWQMQAGSPDNGEGWTTLRCVKLLHQWLAPNGLADLKIAITEAGLDRVGPVPAGAPSGNWRTNAAWWNKENSSSGPIPFNPDAELFYAEQLIWYDRELQKYPNILGATIFTLGSNNPTWTPYRIDGTRVATRLIEHIDQSTLATPTPPVVTPPASEKPMPSSNLLFNPDMFTEGFAPLPGSPSLNVGKGWMLTWATGLTPVMGNPTTAWREPLAVFHSIDGRQGAGILPQSERALYFDDSAPVIWHAWADYGKMWLDLFQIVKNLPAGKYTYTEKIYPDIYTGDHLFDQSPDSGQWRVTVSGQPEVDFENGGTHPNQGDDPNRRFFGRWVLLSRTFDHKGGDCTVGMEFLSKWGIEKVGLFRKPPTLTLVAAAPAPVPTPAPVPVPAPTGPAPLDVEAQLALKTAAANLASAQDLISKLLARK